MIKVLIADDQVLIREGIKVIIEQDSDIKVVGMAGNGNEALKLCEKLSPNMVLMDIMMPVCNGIEATKLIKENCENIKIIVLTTFHDRLNVQKALKNGADGFVTKELKPDDLIMTIKCTMNGLRIFHQSVFSTTVRTILDTPEKDEPAEKESPSVLNGRELEIVRMIVYGKSNKEIASHFSLSEGRVKNIITEILKKVNLNDRMQLAVYAFKNKLVL